MPTGTNKRKHPGQMVEGTAPSHVGHVKNMVPDPAATFMRMIVLDVITDPYIIDDNKISYWRHILQVTNYHYCNLLPRNAIIAQRVKSARVRVAQPMFLFPFFPSHLSLPCKPGEMVWAMFEDPNALEKDLGFWFCRITEPHITDDVNHTHPGGKFDQTNVLSLVQRSSGSEDEIVTYDMQNGVAVINSENERTVKAGTEIIDPPTLYKGIDVFDQLITRTDASKIVQYEPVPRFKKRPGDVVLEGSNNSLIVLGTDRQGPAAAYDFGDNLPKGTINPGPVPSILGINATSGISGSAGSIDLVVGRGTYSATNGTFVSTTRIVSVDTNHEEIKKEIAKYPTKLVNGAEGDPDLINDRSRILISQRTSVDSNFGISGYNSQFQIGDSLEGDPAITIKTDKVRILARSDISLIVTNFDYNPASIDNSIPGFRSDNVDEQKWASITIKTNGDIVFTPSKEGYIKLGGDDAKKAIICTDYDAQPEKGEVKAIGPLGPVLVTNDGASFGSGATNQGKVATKILVK